MSDLPPMGIGSLNRKIAKLEAELQEEEEENEKIMEAIEEQDEEIQKLRDALEKIAKGEYADTQYMNEELDIPWARDIAKQALEEQ